MVQVDVAMYFQNSHEHAQVHVQYAYIAMLHDSYHSLTELQLILYTCMGVVHYCESAHLLRYRSEHACTSAIYYQVDLVMEALPCKPIMQST